ncbi:MAG: hypothetical protein AAGJ87_07210, partial [Pseudomonadota bacterium]
MRSLGRKLSRKAASAFIAAVPLLTAGSHAAANSEAYANFLVREAALRAELEAASVASVEEAKRAAAFALADHYAAHALYPEALAAIAEAEFPSPDVASRTALWSYKAGRILDTLDAVTADVVAASPEMRLLRAKAYARLGAYQSAASDFRALQTDAAPGARDNDHALLEAEALIEIGDSDNASAVLAAIDAAALAAPEAQLLRARIAAHSGAGETATENLQRIIHSGNEPWSSRAAVALARLRGGASVDTLRQLKLRVGDEKSEREVLMMLADEAARDQDLPKSLALYEAIISDHPRSDAASSADARIRRLLPEIALAESPLSPFDAAALFFEYIRFAPPGASGDALIRSVADRLVSLDLRDRAAMLLEHQVFERLRGEAKTTVAADLAALYLEDGKPREALRVLRSTRRAGVTQEVSDARLLLEAKALDATGDGDKALALLSQSSLL